jgi:hypothetical protein
MKPSGGRSSREGVSSLVRVCVTGPSVIPARFCTIQRTDRLSHPLSNDPGIASELRIAVNHLFQISSLAVAEACGVKAAALLPPRTR